MKKKTNYTKLSTKSLTILYLLNKRNKDIKNKTQLFKMYRFFFLNFKKYLLHLTKNKTFIKSLNTFNLSGLYRQVNLLNKYSYELLKYSSNNKISEVKYNNQLIPTLYINSIYSLYHLFLILNQN